jgi:hypothetical protein
MKKLFNITEEERKKILNLHENAANKQYLVEGITINFDASGKMTATDGKNTVPVDGTKTLDQIKAMFPGMTPLQKQAPAPLQTQNVQDTQISSNLNLGQPAK